MPVPTLEAPNNPEFHGSSLNSESQWIPETRDEYLSYGQEMPSIYSENTVIIQVNPGETFTIQNEDGTYRNIPGPAQVPMVSQNGVIPPIFVPPGYISQVKEENGVRRVVVVPSAIAASMGEGNFGLPSAPLFHGPPAVPHIPFPMNGFHHNHMHPVFQHPHVFPNCRPDAVQYLPRPMFVHQDGTNNNGYVSERQCETTVRPQQGFNPFYPQPFCQAIIQQQQNLDQTSWSEPSNLEVSSPRNIHTCPQPIVDPQHETSSTPTPQTRVVCCAFSPQGEIVSQRWPVNSDSRPRSSDSNCAGLPGSTSAPLVNIYPLQCDSQQGNTPLESTNSKEYMSDSAYSSMRQSCPSETSPLNSPSCVSLQSSTIEYHPEIQEHPEASQLEPDSPPGTSSTSPDSASSLGSSPHGSPKASSRANGHCTRRSPIPLDAEVRAFKPTLPPANLNSFPPCSQDVQSSYRSPDLTDDERRTPASPASTARNNKSNGLSGVRRYETIEELLATVKRPKVHHPRPRSAVVVWSLLPVQSAVTSLQSKLGRRSIRFDLHRKSESGKFESAYSGFDLQCTITDLRPATEYGVKLYASCEGKRGPASDVTYFRTSSSYPDAPQPPKIQFKSKTYLVLRWTTPCDNGEKIIRYHLEVTDAPHSSTSTRILYTTALRQFKVPKLVPARSYVFRLAAENKLGKSPWSAKVTYSTGGVILATPDAPRLAKALVRSLALTWSKPGPEVTGYILEMSPDATGYGFRTVYDGLEAKYTVKSLNRNSYYKFRLMAYTANEKSNYSETVSYCTCSDKPTRPAKPQVKGSIHSNHFKVSWDCPNGYAGSEGLKYALEMASKKGPMQEIYCGGDQEYIVDRLEAGQTYRFRLFCVVNGENSLPSDVLAISTPPITPGTCTIPTLSLRPQPRSLTIKWVSSQSGGAMVYDLRCIASCDLCDKEPWIAYTGNDTEATIDDLKPGTKYSLAVRATNKAGIGPWSDYMEAITSPSEPEKPEVPEATVLSSSSIHLQWSPPPNNGAEISNYQLSWGAQKDSYCSSFTGPVLAHELQSLSPNTTYYYCIQAINCIGMGPVSGVGNARTCPSSPDQVTGLGIGFWDNATEEDRGPVTSSRIFIRWSKPRDNGSDILGYKVHCNVVMAENNSSTPPIEVDASSTSYCIKDLTPDTSYSIKVCAFNMISCGCFSSTLNIRTKAPPPPPPRLSCVAAAFNSLELEWTNRSKVGADTTYLLQIQDKFGRFTRAYKGPLQSHKRKNLVENSTYLFRIRTTDSNGVGNFSHEYAFNTPYQLPAAMDAPSVYGITESKCKVSWRKAKEIKKDTIYYRLYLVMEKDNFQKTFTCDGTSYILDYLAPGTSYRLQVCAVRQLDTALRIVEGSSVGNDSTNTNGSSDLLGPPSSFTTFNTRPSDRNLPFSPNLTPCVENLPENFRSNTAKSKISSIQHRSTQISATTLPDSADVGSDLPRDLKCHKLLSYFMFSAFFFAYMLQLFLVSH